MDLKYTTKSYSGTTWSDQRIDWSGISGEWTSLALDSNEDVFISYVDETWDRLKFADLSGSSSRTETHTSGSHEIISEPQWPSIQTMRFTFCTMMMKMGIWNMLMRVQDSG